MPGRTGKQNEHGEQFKPSEKHKEGKDNFLGKRITGKVFYRADKAETGPDIADTGQGSAQIGNQIIFAAQGDKETACQNQGKIHKGKLSDL